MRRNRGTPAKDNSLQPDPFPVKREKVPRKYAVSAALSLLIVLVSLVYFLLDNLYVFDAGKKAEKGVLDLTGLDLRQARPVELNGEWEFFPGEFIEPFQASAAGGQYMKTPSSWDLSSGKGDGSKGFGSYRLLVKVKEDGLYAIKTNTIRSSARIYLNGDEAISLGVPSRDPDSYSPESRFCEGFVASQDGEIEIVVQVANYLFQHGGILKPIRFGTPGSILGQTYRERAVELFIAVSFFLAGALFLLVNLARNRSRALFYFSLASCLMGVHLLTMNNQNLSLFFSYTFYGRMAIEAFSVVGGSMGFLLFARYYFSQLVNRRVFLGIKLFLAATLMLLLAKTLNINLLSFQATQYLAAASTALSYAYLSYILVKAMRRRAESVEYLLVVAGALLSYWGSLLLKYIFETKVNYLSEILLLLVMVSMTLMIARKLKLEYTEATELTEERLEKEFKYFFSQISPHFLYNTLNTIIALSYEDSGKTREALRNLALYFRGKLDLHFHKGLISLESEIDLVVAYLEIEKLRYGDKLNLVLAIDPDIEARIPPLTLQPLAENAVRHGIAPKESPGTVTIKVGRCEDGKILISVSDDGTGMAAENLSNILRGESERVGLQNVIKKIKLMPGASVKLESQPNQGTRITLCLPEADHA